MSEIKMTFNNKKVKGQIDEALEAAMEKSLLLIEGQAKLLVAVDTGNLRDKITHEQQKVSSSQLVGKVGSPTEYATDQEFGTLFQKGKAFLRPSFRMNKPKVQEILSSKLRQTFE